MDGWSTGECRNKLIGIVNAQQTEQIEDTLSTEAPKIRSHNFVSCYLQQNNNTTSLEKLNVN